MFQVPKARSCSEELPLVEGRTEVRTGLNQSRKTQLTNAKKRFTKAMMAAWGDTSKEEEDSQDEEEAVALMA